MHSMGLNEPHCKKTKVYLASKCSNLFWSDEEMYVSDLQKDQYFICTHWKKGFFFVGQKWGQYGSFKICNVTVTLQISELATAGHRTV